MGELKGSREMICPKCGRPHMVEADYFTVGISGTIVNSRGVPVIFVDPTDPPMCEDCVCDMLKQLMIEDSM